MQEAKEAKEEAFAQGWKTIKQGQNKPLDEEEIEFLDEVEDAAREDERRRIERERDDVETFRLARETMVVKAAPERRNDRADEPASEPSRNARVAMPGQRAWPLASSQLIESRARRSSPCARGGRGGGRSTAATRTPRRMPPRNPPRRKTAPPGTTAEGWGLARVRQRERFVRRERDSGRSLRKVFLRRGDERCAEVDETPSTSSVRVEESLSFHEAHENASALYRLTPPPKTRPLPPRTRSRPRRSS